MTELSTSPLCVPFTRMAVRGSSTSFGCRASKTRFERAFLGLLLYRSETFFRYRHILTSYVAYLHESEFGACGRARKSILPNTTKGKVRWSGPNHPSKLESLNEIECYCHCYSTQNLTVPGPSKWYLSVAVRKSIRINPISLVILLPKVSPWPWPLNGAQLERH